MSGFANAEISVFTLTAPGPKRLGSIFQNFDKIRSYSLYFISTPSFTPPHTLAIPRLHNNHKLQYALADAYEAPPQNANLP